MLLLNTSCSPLLLISLVSIFTIFVGQMGVDLHRCHDTCMPQPFLHKLPVYWFTILQVGTDEGSRVRVSQSMGMKEHARFLRVVLEDLFHCSSCYTNLRSEWYNRGNDEGREEDQFWEPESHVPLLIFQWKKSNVALKWIHALGF